MVLFAAFGLSANLSHGQINYTFTGFANDFNNPGSLAPEVLDGESYFAQFQIDGAVPDSDPDPTLGQYTSAILFGSIQFSGGYTSLVDFTGGEVSVQQNSGGGIVSLTDLNGLGSVVLSNVGNPFASDQLVTDLGAALAGSPQATFVLTEPTGTLRALDFDDDVGFPSVVPEPSTACFLGFCVLACALRRRR